MPGQACVLGSYVVGEAQHLFEPHFLSLPGSPTIVRGEGHKCQC